MLNVVGTMFFKDGKLLINKLRKRPTFQMVGGAVEEGETILEAAIRECHEELGTKVVFDESKIMPVMDFVEIDTSDPTKKIHMHIFKYDGILEGELEISSEIEKFMWFGIDDDMNLLSNTLKNEVVPYCIENKLIFSKENKLK